MFNMETAIAWALWQLRVDVPGSSHVIKILLRAGKSLNKSKQRLRVFQLTKCRNSVRTHLHPFDTPFLPILHIYQTHHQPQVHLRVTDVFHRLRDLVNNRSSNLYSHTQAMSQHMQLHFGTHNPLYLRITSMRVCNNKIYNIWNINIQQVIRCTLQLQTLVLGVWMWRLQSLECSWDIVL